MTSKAKATGSTTAKKGPHPAKKDLKTKISALSEEFVHDSDSDEANGAIQDIEASCLPKKRRKLHDSHPAISASLKVPNESTIKTTKPGTVERRITSRSLKGMEVSSSDESQKQDSESSESDDNEGTSQSRGKGKTDASNRTQGNRKRDETHKQLESHDEDIRTSQEDSEEQSGDSDSENFHHSRESINQTRQRAKPNLEPIIQSEFKPYKPPPGFEVQSSSASSSELADLCSPQTLAGKKIWYITAPASIPLNSVKEVNPESILNSKAVLSYKNADYGFTIGDNDAQIRERLLLPNPKGDTYHSTNFSIARSIHLRQLVRLPGTIISQATTTESGHLSVNSPKVYTKAFRQQPEGLRMRYKPFGDTDPASSGGSDDDTTPKPQFHVPGVLETNQHFYSKNDQFNVVNGEGHEKYVTPKKQRKKSLNVTPNGEAASAKRSNGGSEIVSNKVPCDEDGPEKSNIKGKTRKKLSISTPNQQSPGGDEDKAGRKAERARRKEKALRCEEKTGRNTSYGMQSSQSKALGIDSPS